MERKISEKQQNELAVLKQISLGKIHVNDLPPEFCFTVLYLHHDLKCIDVNNAIAEINEGGKAYLNYLEYLETVEG